MSPGQGLSGPKMIMPPARSCPVDAMCEMCCCSDNR